MLIGLLLGLAVANAPEKERQEISKALFHMVTICFCACFVFLGYMVWQDYKSGNLQESWACDHFSRTTY